MLVLWIVWAVLTLCVIGLALYRKFEAHFHEDDLLHLAAGESKFIPNQVATARLLDKVDSVGKALTAVDVAFGVTLVAIVLYNAWVESQKFMMH
jgi:hypothetical protein